MAFFLFTGNAWAQIPSSYCDGIPDTYTSPLSYYLVDKANASDDSQFTQGSKDGNQISANAWASGNANDKGDITNASASLVQNTSGQYCILRFSGDRTADNGDAAIGFWFYKDPTVSANPDGSFTGTHMDGDILIISQFTNGGGTSTPVAYEWQNGQLVPLTSASGCSQTNTTTISAALTPDNYTGKFAPTNQYRPGTYFEGYINLCGISGVDLCFSKFLVETRNSQSIDASLQDFVLGNFNIRPNSYALTGGSYCPGGSGAAVTLADSDLGVSYQLQRLGGASPVNVGSPILGDGDDISFGVQPAGTYQVVATTTGTTCSSTFGNATVQPYQAEVANAGGDFTKTCTSNPNGKTIGEAAQAGYTYSWSPTAGLSDPNVSNPTANPTVTTTYTVTKTNTTTGCSDTDDVTVTVDKPTVTANAGSGFTISCSDNTSGGSIGEASQTGYTYSWSPIAGLSDPNVSNPTANPSVTTVYTVTKTHTASGCSDTDEVTVTVNKPTVVAVAGDDFTKTCTSNPNGKAIGEEAQAGYTYSWVSSPTGFTSTDANPTVNPTVTTTYTVTKTHTASGCSDTDEVTVNVDIALPSGTVTGGALDCTSGTFTISAANVSPAGATFTWYGPASVGGANGGKGPVINNLTASLTVSAIGTYTLRITNPSNGCSIDVTAVVTPAVNCNPVQGCTLGYWKNHVDRWCDTYSTALHPDLTYGDVFASAPAELENLTLLQVLNLGGGGIYNLGRQSVAALLNICSSEVNYTSAYPTTASLINAVNAAFASGSKTRIANLGTLLDTYNNAGCPLGGSPATTSATSSSSSSSLYSNENSLRLHPNPFSDKTTIEFTSEQGGTYELVLYDMSGRLVKKVSSGLAEAGKPYSITIRSAMLKEGMYLARLRVGNVTRSVKVILKR
ncbi:hypothetical protein GCM10027189_13460 [Rufibacter soli]